MGEWCLFSILSIHFILSGQTYKRVLSCKNIFSWEFVRCPVRKAVVWKTISDAISAQLEYTPGPLFTKRTGVLPPNLVKSRSRVIGCYIYLIALKFDSICNVSLFYSGYNMLNGNTFCRQGQPKHWNLSCLHGRILQSRTCVLGWGILTFEVLRDFSWFRAVFWMTSSGNRKVIGNHYNQRHFYNVVIRTMSADGLALLGAVETQFGFCIKTRSAL